MKKFLGILVVCLLAGGAYLLLQKTTTFHTIIGSVFSSASSSPLSLGSITASISSSTAPIITHSESAITHAAQDTTHIVTQSALHTATSFITQALQGATQGMIKGIDALTGTPPQTTNQFSPVAYIVHVNTPLSFQLSHSYLSDMQDGFSCVVQWGDGQQTQQNNIRIANTITFSHTWNASGTYTMTFTLTLNTIQHIYTMPIIVQ